MESNWISVEDRTPEPFPGKQYSPNVLAILDGELAVMCYGYNDFDDEGGWGWSNCYGNIDGDPEYDDDYKPTHWMPLPEPLSLTPNK